MLRLVEQMQATAGELDSQAETLAGFAAMMNSKLRGFKEWAVKTKADAQTRHEAVVAALEEENKEIQVQYSSMLSALEQMLSDIEGTEKGDING